MPVPSPNAIRHPVRVGYGDTDQGGIVHHAVYLRWLEQARIELLRSRGIEYRALEYDRHFALPVARAQLRYHQPARFDEELEVECWLGKVGHASLRFDYRVWRGETLIHEAELTLACIRLPESKPTRLPPDVRAACETEP